MKPIIVKLAPEDDPVDSNPPKNIQRDRLDWHKNRSTKPDGTKPVAWIVEN
jgi:hypothetical protein